MSCLRGVRGVHVATQVPRSCALKARRLVKLN